jgi:hypothetical protein
LPARNRPQKGEHSLKPIRSIAITWIALWAFAGGLGTAWEANAFDPGPQLNTVQPEAAPFYLALSASGAKPRILDRTTWLANWQKSDEWLPPHRSLKVLDYSTPIRTRQGDLTLNLEAPGAGRAILSLGVEF